VDVKEDQGACDTTASPFAKGCDRWHASSLGLNVKINVKGSGQERPLHTIKIPTLRQAQGRLSR